MIYSKSDMPFIRFNYKFTSDKGQVSYNEVSGFVAEQRNHKTIVGNSNGVDLAVYEDLLMSDINYV